LFVTGNFFEMLQLQAHAGRLLLPNEGETLGTDPVVVLSYSYWKGRFQEDLSVIGKHARINGRPVTIVGVSPKGFFGGTPIIETQADLGLGMVGIEGVEAGELFTNAKAATALVVARLRDGISAEQAKKALENAGREITKENPRQGIHSGLLVNPVRPPGLITG